MLGNEGNGQAASKSGKSDREQITGNKKNRRRDGTGPKAHAREFIVTSKRYFENRIEARHGRNTRREKWKSDRAILRRGIVAFWPSFVARWCGATGYYLAKTCRWFALREERAIIEKIHASKSHSKDSCQAK